MSRAFALSACLVAALMAPAGAMAAERAGDRIAGPVSAAVIKVRDGDTIEVEARIWPGQVVRVAVRLRGIDAPELKAKCTGEAAAAVAARDRLMALVAGSGVELLDISGDKYFGRVLARVSAGGEADVARRLMSEGLVAAYDGGTRRDWCSAWPRLSSVHPGVPR